MAIARKALLWMKRHKILSALIILLVAISIAVISARLWIKSDSGRDYILSQINGRDVAGYGTLSAEGLTGDPLKAIQLKALMITDAEGAWLEIDSAQVDWHPFRLLSKSVDLDLVEAKEIRILRRPTRAPRPPQEQQEASGYTVALDTLKIDRLFLAEGVAGDAAAFSIAGELDQDASGALVGAADIVPLEGRGDRLSLTASVPTKNAYIANAKVEAPAGGVIATLLKLPEGSAAGVVADVSLDGGVGEVVAVLDIDGTQAVTVSGSLNEDVFALDVAAEMGRLPVPDQVKAAAVGESTVKVTGTLDDVLADFAAIVELGAGRVDLKGVLDTKTRRLEGPLAVETDALDLRAIGNVAATLDLDGLVSQEGESVSYRGRVGLERLTDDALPFARVGGDLDVSLVDRIVNAKIDMTVTEALATSEQIAEILGESLGVKGAVTYGLDAEDLGFQNVTLKLADGSATANGDINLASKRLNITGQLNQGIALLRPDFGGQIAGSYTVSGTTERPVLTTGIRVRDLSGLPGAAEELIGSSPKLDSTVTYLDGVLNIQKASLTADGIDGFVKGTFGQEAGANIDIRARQKGALSVSGTDVLLGDFVLQLRGPVGALEAKLESLNGVAKRGENVADNVAIKADVARSAQGWSGPVNVTADVSGSPFSIASKLTSGADGIALNDIVGAFAAIEFRGDVSQSGETGLSAQLNASSEAFVWASGSAERFDLDLVASQAPDAPLSLRTKLNVKGVGLASGLRFESLDVSAEGTEGVFEYATNAVGKFGVNPFDTDATGSVDLRGDAPAGQIVVSGHIFDQLIKSNRPLKWKLGERPEVDIDLLLLGGELDLRLTDAGDKTALTYDARELEVGPLLAPFGLTAADTRISGSGNVRPYGTAPSGNFSLAARSPIPGLENSLDFDVKGNVSARGVDVTGRTQFGNDLTALVSAIVPLRLVPARVADVNMDAPLRGTLSLKGNLASARQAALAFGHDVGGRIDASGVIAGSLRAPDVSGTARLENGIYEFGATGMRIRDLTMDARYDKNDFTLVANGKSADGGTVALNGKMTEQGPLVNLKFKRFLAFDQRGDTAIVSGGVDLKMGPKERGVTGELNIDSARFSLENLPQSGPRAIDVRWSDAPEDEDVAGEATPLRLDLTIKAERQIFLKGRGFDGEWGADIRLAGTAKTPEIYGAAKLIRGQLDLVGRPLVFDAGQIVFDGEINRTRLDIAAERRANDLTTRVALTGPLAKPTIELTSSPDLPQDEILSRLLFSRASIDLTAFEAAQLAGTFRRLRGDAAFFDPAEELQAALGVDRLSFGANEEGVPQVGVGQYLADNVYLQINTAGAAGTSAEVEWQPIPQVAVTSETKADGEGRVSLRWKKDY